MVKFRWLGGAGVELEANGQILAIDPFFTRPPMQALWLSRVSPNRKLVEQYIRKYDYLLISHAHYDHVMDVPIVLEKTGASA
jgi:L-ascorbate metabolism protein UlaG (beta-lactamase superfamily)